MWESKQSVGKSQQSCKRRFATPLSSSFVVSCSFYRPHNCQISAHSFSRFTRRSGDENQAHQTDDVRSSDLSPAAPARPSRSLSQESIPHDTFEEDLWDGASQSSHFFFEERSSPLPLLTQSIVVIY